MFWIILTTTLFLVDIAIKAGIESLRDETFPRKLKKIDEIEICKAHNDGLAVGLFKKYQRLVMFLPTFCTGFLLAKLMMEICKSGRMLKKLALCLVTAGGLGNVFDRAFRGYVVDYILVKRKPLDKIIFNLADVFVVVGGVLFVIDKVVRRRK